MTDIIEAAANRKVNWDPEFKIVVGDGMSKDLNCGTSNRHTLDMEGVPLVAGSVSRALPLEECARRSQDRNTPARPKLVETGYVKRVI